MVIAPTFIYTYDKTFNLAVAIVNNSCIFFTQLTRFLYTFSDGYSCNLLKVGIAKGLLLNQSVIIIIEAKRYNVVNDPHPHPHTSSSSYYCNLIMQSEINHAHFR